MSESNTAAAAAAADSASDTAASDAAAAAAAAAAADTGGAGDTAAADAAAGADAGAAADQDPKPKPKPGDRRFANLSARTATLQAELDAAQRRADAAEALLRAGKTGDGETPAPRPQPAGDVETRAAQLVAEREFNGRLAEIDASGKKELGADAWEAVKATMTGLGAAGNQAFLQALAETENPAKIFASLADDTDALMGLLTKPPAAMAAKLGRMDAELSKPATAKLSGAPKPAAKVEGAGTLPTVDLYNYPANMPMSEYAKIIDAQLPPHLGGKRRSA